VVVVPRGILARGDGEADLKSSLFRTSYYHVWTSDDFVGVEVCAAAKNCYALGAGFADGILERLGEKEGADRNYNYTAALFGQGAAELGQFMQLLGGRPETPYGLAGVGDMYVTSAGGRNVRVGRLIGTGMRFSEARETMPGVTLEGAAAIAVIGGALAKLTERGITAPDEFPLMRHLHAVVAEDKPLDMPWCAFFGGEPHMSQSKNA
jgi:glycerol-3-phosphate dehydrogenase (NAD(P)+)